MRDPADDVRDAIRRTQRLIDKTEDDGDKGTHAYLKYLRDHKAKLEKLLAKHEDGKQKNC